MPPLLKRDGKFVKKGDKLVRSDDPANCSCCNVCPCLADPIDIVSTALKDEGEDIRVEWVVQWNVPQECDTKYDFEFEYLNQEGKLLGRSNTPASVGQSTHSYTENKEDVCSDPAKRTAKIRGRVIDLQDNCAPSPWAEKDVGPYDDICPPPPEKDCCYTCDSGVYPDNPDDCPEGYTGYWFGGAWWCLRYTPISCPIYDGDGNPTEDHRRAEEDCLRLGGNGSPSQEPCPQPPTVRECCLVCELPGPPPEKCPDGFFFASNGLCQKYFPTDCSDGQIADAAQKCAAAGGGAVGQPDAPCPEPPPPSEPCPAGKICTWSPPDCGDGECWKDGEWGEGNPLPPEYCAPRPYDCTSKAACEAWLAAHPNPPCFADCADGLAVFEWQAVSPTLSRWTLVWEECSINGCDPYNVPPDPGSFVGERREMPCLPRARKNQPSSKKAAPPQPSGPGTELKKLLGRIGITATPTCECNKKAAVMDFHGPKWCRDNLEMLVGWLREEAQKRRLPFSDIVGRHLLKYAIRQAEKKRVTGEGEGHK